MRRVARIAVLPAPSPTTMPDCTYATARSAACCFSDGLPVGDAGAAQWIHADVDSALPNRLQVDHRRKIPHIGLEIVMQVGG